MSWYEIYVEEIKLKKDKKKYVNYKIKHKKKLISLITKYSSDKILEAGCGTGIISTYLASLGYYVKAVDIDIDILKLSKEIADEYSSLNKPIFEKMDIFNLDVKEEFDVVFSNGVLEHFTDIEIKEIIKRQLDIAKYVIIGIPTIFFNQDEALYGDERFLPLEHWRKLFSEINSKIVDESAYHYMTLIERIRAFKKWSRPLPFHIFVLANIKM